MATQNRFITALLFCAVMFSGCVNNQKIDVVKRVTAKQKPAWVLNPNLNGKIGAVGIAGNTYDLKPSTKRKLAIQRALDELAMQEGVKVELVMDRTERVVNDSVSTKMDTKTKYTTSKTVKAHLQAMWEDKLSDELYIWLVLD